MKQYSDLSYTLTRDISKKDKKNNGIYFTPPNTVSKNIDFLEKYLVDFKDVLEPSCGSCEYILQLNEKHKHLEITGIELNKKIYDSVKELENEKITIYNDNYLTYKNNKKYDLIIGNPPYFVMKKNDVDKEYYNYFDGRPNIFILFIIKSLKLLKNNGILSFVLPKSFVNCLYYNKTRGYINENFKILDIVECVDKYIETQQETIILIVQKTTTEYQNSKYYLNVGSSIIFGTPQSIVELSKLYENSTSLTKLGFKVKVGTVVWNQCKDILTNDNSKSRLIYSSDIKNNKLIMKEYSNKQKKNYIDKDGETDPLLVINRGYGVGTYNFNYCIINEHTNDEYLIENHLIYIKYNKTIDNNTLIDMYKKIIMSFKHNKTKKFIKIYFGNNAINTSELANILPIYL